MSNRLSFLAFVIFTLAVFTLAAQEARSDYETGLKAWEANRHAQAIAHWQQTADTGDGKSMLALGRAYALGLGVLRNLPQAHKWFNLAASRGVAEALEERDKLEQRMTAEERAEADKLASTWQPSQAKPDAGEKVTKKQSSAQSTSSALTSKRAIRESQSLLSKLGYKPGPADGIWGRRTGTAYRAFLADRKLPIVDVLTEPNLSELRKSAAAQPASDQKKPTIEAIELYRTAASGNSKQIDDALKAGTDINQLDRRGWSALMYAADIGNERAVKLLIAKGAGSNVKSPDGSTAITLARKSGHREIVNLLSASSASSASTRTHSQSSSNRQQDVNKNVKPGSAEDFFLGILQILADESVLDTDSRDHENEFSKHLGRRPSAETVDENGWTDLHWAAVMDLPNTAVRLVDEGAAINSTTREDGRRFSSRLVSDLSSVKANYSWDQWQRDGVTPLHVAAYSNSQNTVNALIDKGAYIDAENTRGETPLHYAIWVGSLEIARSFLSKNAYVNFRAVDGQTPLHFAAQRNSADGASLLISHGARIEVRDRGLSTALHAAVRENAVDAARVLLNHGADRYARNRSGIAPIDIARQSGSAQMRELLGVY